MKVKDLKGRITTWKLSGYVVAKNSPRVRSQYHLQARDLIEQLYRNEAILEEVLIPGEQLYLDFYLPIHKIAVEVHGEQHYQFIPHFHVDMMGFLAHKKRDAVKGMWCEINGIRLVELPYNEDIDAWTKRFNDRREINENK